MWKRVTAVSMILPVLAAAQAPSDWNAVRNLTSGTPLKITLQGHSKPTSGTCRLINATESDLLCSMMTPYHEWLYPLKRIQILRVNLAIPKPNHHLAMVVGGVLTGLLVVLGLANRSGGGVFALMMLPILAIATLAMPPPFPQPERNPDYKAGLMIYQAR